MHIYNNNLIHIYYKGKLSYSTIGFAASNVVQIIIWLSGNLQLLQDVRNTLLRHTLIFCTSSLLHKALKFAQTINLKSLWEITCSKTQITNSRLRM